MQKQESYTLEKGEATQEFDDDGQIKRTGTWISASAHIITAVVGSGVLSLTWCLAQLGWIFGSFLLVVFAVISWYTCTLLTNCYRSPHPVTGARNYNYMQAVKTNLGGRQYIICAIAQYGTLIGVSIGYTITSSISMGAIKRSNCFKKYGHDKGCHTLNSPFLLIVACIELVLSQLPNFHKLSFLSIIAAIMSFVYSTIGMGLSIAKIAGGLPKTSIGMPTREDVSSKDKTWDIFCAIGDIAFAYGFADVLVEIQDTLKSNPPEHKVMKTATTVGISASTLFYMLCGLLGYAAFGNDAPGNYLTGFGFYDPFWLVDIANLCIAIHLLGAYQVIMQPVFGFIENWSRRKWPERRFINKEYAIGFFRINLFRLTWRSTYVILATLVAMMFPFFNAFLALIGSTTFWPLTVYFPIEMYIVQAKIRRNSFRWIWLRALSLVCLLVSCLAAAASIRGLVGSVQTSKLFLSVS
ncbi:putative amino acid transporter, transmembrane domain-containing protein [Helianthus annuus]|nr:putative amino acid transporter, transmembrane domain-containing protein [Helianthus annuus]